MTHYRGKRAFDLITLAAVSVPSVAIGLACALAIRLTSRGSIFFRQERIGLDGRPFRIVKFRTMVESDDNPIFPTVDRMTPVGRWLRRFSLDELPQLINVARGEMSMVGPRPTLPYQVARYNERQRRRLAVRPGITGLAQVRGRNTLSWPERIEVDLEYVERQSVVWDLKVLIWTVAIVIRGSGIGGHPTDDVLARPE